MINTMRGHWQRVGIAAVFSLFVFSQLTSNSLALSSAQQTLYEEGINYFDSSTGSCTTSASDTTPAASTTTISLPTNATAEQKIAQTFVVGFDASTPQSLIDDIATKYHIGGIYLVGTSDAAGAGFTKAFFDKLGTDAGTPLTIASDEEGGQVTRFTYPNITGGFPSAKTMGTMSDSQVQQLGQEVGQQLTTDGVTADLAPVLDLDDGTNFISQHDRSFSSDPSTVAAKAGSFAQGLESSGVTPVFKHFPGFGGAGPGDTDTTPVTTPSSYDLSQNVSPYKQLLDQSQTSNAGVMLSNLFVTNLTNGKPASISSDAVNYLRSNLSFSGLITTDDLSALANYGAQAVDLPTAVTDALNAGVDMPLFSIGTTDQATAESKIQSIISAVSSGVSGNKIDSADSQVLTFKNSSSTTSTSTDTGGCCGSGSTTGFGGTLDQFMQAIAIHESGDIPTSDSGNGAYGKYQFIQSTWQGDAAQYYPPAQQFATANLAPEEVQDALMYLVYDPVYKQANGDIFAMAIDHYYPADFQTALKNPNDPSLNYAPPGNNGLTLKEYGDTIAQAVSSGQEDGKALSSVPLLYASAPDFQMYLTKDGGPASSSGTPTTTVAPSSSSCSGSGSGGTTSTGPASNFTFYSQYDPRWATDPYGPGTTVASSGCGPTSVAEVVATLADSSVTPAQTAAWGQAHNADQGQGSIWSIMLVQGPENWGLHVTQLGSDMNQAIDVLNSGGLVIIAGTGSAPFTADGHILVLRGIASDGNFLVGDPNSPASNPGDPTAEYSAQQIESAGLQAMFGVTK